LLENNLLHFSPFSPLFFSIYSGVYYIDPFFILDQRFLSS